MTTAKTLRSFVLLGFLAVAVTACATTPDDPEQRKQFEATNDPLEPMNREIFDANLFLDHLLWGPISGLYQAVIPPYIRDRVHNVLANMNEPINFMNNILQAQFDRAGMTFERFAVNTTAGGAGLFDVASDIGVPEQHGDFGQTLWTWGVGDGPYLVLPFFGPSNPRDVGGMAVDAVADPWSYLVPNNEQLTFDIARFSVEGIDRRAEVGDALDELEKTSVDFYAQMRSVSRQYRQKELRGGDDSASDDQLKDLYRDDLYGDTGTAKPAMSKNSAAAKAATAGQPEQ